MYPIKQSTAITVPIFVHDENGDAVTGLVDGGFTKRISKNGGAFAAMTVTITELENGWYAVPISTSHSNTLGLMSITFTHASSKQVNLQFRVEAKLVDDLNDFDAANDDVAVVTLNSDMRGTDSASTLDAAGIRTALGMASADLDTQLDALLAVVDSTGVEVSAAAAIEIADALLKRDFSAVSGESARSALNALRFLRNKWSIAGTTLTVTEEDDSTTAWTAAMSVDASADPVTGSDPA